jgi:hypothetical protein
MGAIDSVVTCILRPTASVLKRLTPKDAQLTLEVDDNPVASLVPAVPVRRTAQRGRARARICCACTMRGWSIIWPSSWVTPSVTDAAMTASAHSISRAVGR